MLGLLVIIVVSWVLLHFIEKKSIDALGIIPYEKRLIQFLIGLFFMMLVTFLTIYIESVVLTVDWQLKSPIDYTLIFKSFMYHLRSALTEDLIFRGAILYILISKLGAKWALLISAAAFGVYHVFSYGMTSERFVPIFYVILVTGFTGYVWAYTFNKTKSIMMALGFHLGYNLVMTFFYTSQPYGELLFTELSRINVSELNGLYYALFKGLFPSIITLAFVKFLLLFDLKLFIIKQQT
ncbi:CPBP family intramembrane glutamic endopeptidase [Algibacter mikhailovii]|uniref:CAAX prenyl protease 2/Lysostaphin resistance protein A-like domain-containing protein n=1 Tax=Algibacter mikhailovii TaxID=425498 RepID=A0A918R123_9FLAO|nr:CPBP family intramembrane glutamic endopeptidase [Algibacter mikhailovii]GGZ82178.1 hypothetical protein GCM10007028_19940 [Algibacter mikhailovii]